MWVPCLNDLRGNIVDRLFQIVQNSGHGELCFLNVQMGMTATLAMQSLTERASRSAARVRNGSLVYSQFVAVNSTRPDSSVRENPIPASSLTEPALLLRSGTAKT